MKILFQGDSITDGNRYKSKASEWDKNHQIGHSYVYIVTGLLGMKHPERRFEFFNRGISGNTVEALAARWQTDTLSLQPDVLSVLIGINDCLQASAHRVKDLSASAYESEYRKILTECRKQNSDIKLILMEPFAYVEQQKNNDSSVALRKAILQSEQKAVRRLAEEFHAVFIPLQEVFDEAAQCAEPAYWIWDGVHPTEAGHALIAREFLKATSEIFGISDSPIC